MLDRFLNGKWHFYIFIFLMTAVFAPSAAASLIVGHHYTAEKAFLHGETPKAIKNAIATHENAYYLGTQGPDWTYWAGDVRNFGGNRHAYEMHEDRRSGTVIRQMITDLKHMKQRKDKRYDKYLAFVAGWITHYITDTYVHYLVGLYGGNYMGWGGASGEDRHAQLEIVENTHACIKARLFKQFFLRDDEDIRRLLSSTLYGVYGDWDFARGDFASTKLVAGLGILDTAAQCFKQMCESGTSTCDWNPADLFLGTLKHAKFLDKDSYLKIMNCFEEEEDKQTIFDIRNGKYDRTEAIVKSRIKIWDTGFYKKFLTDWDTSTVRAIKTIVDKFRILDAILNNPNISEEEIEKQFPDIDILDPNINPERNIDLIDNSEDARFDDAFNSYKRGLYQKPATSLWYSIECDKGCCNPIRGKKLIQNMENDPFRPISPLLNSSYVGLVTIEENLKPRDPDTAECAYKVKFAISDESVIGDNARKEKEWSESKERTILFKKSNIQIEGASEINVKDTAKFKAIFTFIGFAPHEQEAFQVNLRLEWLVDGKVVHTVYDGIADREASAYDFKPDRVGDFEVKVRAVRKLVDGTEREVVASAPHIIKVTKQEITKPGKETTAEEAKKPPDTAAVGKGELSFSGTAFDIWEGGNTPEGFLLRRIKAKGGRISEPCPHPAEVWAEAWGRLDRARSLRTQEDIAKILNEELEGYKALRWRKEGAIREISVGDFKGLFLDTKIRFGSGGWSPEMGFSPCSIDASGHGYVIKGERVVELFYSVGGSGCFDNSQRPFLESQAAAAQGEAKAIIASLRLVEGGVLSKVPYKGPKLDGSDLPQVKLVPSKIERLKVGDVVKVQAVVENAKPEDSPFKYTWTGDFQGSGSTVSVRATKPGKFTLSVSVDGARYNLGSASVEYDVADLRVRIERVPPDTKPVPVGTKTGFKATLTADGKPASGTFIYRWQPHPEVAFDKLDSSAPEVQAAFPKPGRVKVWVQVLENREGRESTVAESEQLEVEVIQPQLELTFEPGEPYVGQEVKAKLVVKPEVKEIDFRWMPVPGNAKQSLESKDGKEITFYLKDDKPAEIHVLARVPKSGEDLGEARGTVKAKKYTVGVTGPKAYGPKPKVWKEGVGLVDVENAIAVDQIVEFAADVQPQPQTGPVKYEWRVKSGPCRVSNPIVREARVTAGEAGSCELAVVARDRNDVELGAGSGSFSATITREAIAAGQKKAKDAAVAVTKLQDARGKISQGKLDEAIVDLDAAVKLDPANGEAKQLSQKVRSDMERIRQQIDRAKKLMDENRFTEAGRELTVASNLSGNYPPVQQASRELSERQRAYDSGVQGKIREVRAASEQKEFGRALEIAAAWRASTKLDPNAESALRQQEDWARQMKARKDQQISILKQAGEKVKNYDYAGALKGYEQGFADVQSLFNGREPEYQEAVKLRDEAYAKNKRLQELIPWVRKSAEGKETMTVDALQKTLKTADEAIALQPTNGQLKTWRAQIAAKAEKGKDDNARIAQGRKYLEAARSAEMSFLSIDSSMRSGPAPRWDENAEVSMQGFLVKAIENYRESLKYIPDAAVEKHIRELEANLEARKKFLENVRLSKQLRAEGDRLAREARSESSFEVSQEKFTQAVERYNRSLGLYRPPDEQALRQTISIMGMEKLARAYKKHYADCVSLAQAGRIAEALAACERAAACRYPQLSQYEWSQLAEGIKSLRNQIDSAKRWRAQGEAEERAGKIDAAVTSYRNSLKNVPDAALEQHVKGLETGLAGKGTADRLWQEGTGLYGRGQYVAALDKFKESLGYWSDATRSKFVQDLESRRARAKKLIDEGVKLESQNRIPKAIAKYKESLAVWSDKELADYIRALEARTPATADIGGTWNSNRVYIYVISQAGSTFTWTVKQHQETAQGTISGRDLSVRWSGGPWGTGSAKGKVTKVDSTGRALTIEWDNGALFSRAGAAAPTEVSTATTPPPNTGLPPPPGFSAPSGPSTGSGGPGPTAPPPPKTTCDVNISGTWVSNINVEYTIQQTGCRFFWNLKRYDETCEGTIDGRVISARYSGRQGTAAVKGKVSRYDSAGRPLTIQWEDGSTFNRRP